MHPCGVWRKQLHVCARESQKGHVHERPMFMAAVEAKTHACASEGECVNK